MNNNIIRGSAPEHVRSEITAFLKILQEGYTKRDINLIDSYMDQLFDRNQEVIVLGTSDEEWYFNFDEARELIKSDWEWWGDVSISIDDAIISSSDDIAWLSASGSVGYTFNTSEENYTRWLTFVEKFVKEGREFDGKALKVGLLEMNWKLNHLMHDWGKPRREYLSPIRFTAVLKKSLGRWVFKQIQFSLPAPYLPDIRIDNNNMKPEMLENVKAKLKSYKYGQAAQCVHEIKDLLKDFQREYSGKSAADLDKFADRYFTTSHESYFIGTENYIAAGQEEIKKLVRSHRERYVVLSLYIDEAIISQEDDTAWVITGGYIKKYIKEEDVLKKQMENIEAILAKQLPPKDKLFEIRRNISMTLKEAEKGEEYIWPFRMEGVLLRDSDGWKFNHLQFSHPFYWILEGLRDSHLISE